MSIASSTARNLGLAPIKSDLPFMRLLDILADGARAYDRVVRDIHLAREADSRGKIQRKADNKTSAGGGLSPNVTVVVEDSLAGEGKPKPEAVLLACCDERVKQSVANPARNFRPRIFPI